MRMLRGRFYEQVLGCGVVVRDTRRQRAMVEFSSLKGKLAGSPRLLLGLGTPPETLGPGVCESTKSSGEECLTIVR